MPIGINAGRSPGRAWPARPRKSSSKAVRTADKDSDADRRRRPHRADASPTSQPGAQRKRCDRRQATDAAASRRPCPTSLRRDAPVRLRQRLGRAPPDEGHGRRLTSAFEALEASPRWPSRATGCSRSSRRSNVATADVVTAVESDVALIIAVLRLANRVQERPRARRHVVAAVELLSSQAVQAARGTACGPSTSSSARASGTRRPSASACTRSPPSTRPTGSPRGRLRAPRPPDRHEPAARRRQARAAARLSRLSRPGPPRRPHPRGAHPPGAPRAGRRPRPRRRRADPPLGPARDAIATVDRAPPQPRRSRARPRSSASPTCSPTTSRARGVAGRDAAHRARARPRARRAAARDVRAAQRRPASASATSIPARCPGASSACCSASPRARSTSRSPTS